ncbi:hypothetical protein PMAYCL1PPCAC_18823, partial [Pristionchus mayeri]
MDKPPYDQNPFSSFSGGMRDCLGLVSARRSSSSGALELASLGADEGLDVRVGNSGGTEVSLGFASLAGTLDEEGVLSLGGASCELVDGDDLASGLENTGTSRIGDAESGNGDLGNLEDALVIGDGGKRNNDLVLISGLSQIARDAGNRERSAVLAGHEQASEHNLVELGSSTSGEVLVELDEDAEVRILALGSGPTGLAVVLVIDVDTHLKSL